jgi:hypothetical protein
MTSLRTAPSSISSTTTPSDQSMAWQMVKRKPYASQYHQGAAYGYQQKITTVNTTTNSNTQRHRPQACIKIRVPRRSSKQQHELRRTMGGNLIENRTSY